MDHEHTTLIIRKAGDHERHLRLRPGTYQLGRAPDCSIVLPEQAVSRRHARISVQPGLVDIEDTGSGNGTWWKGQRVRRQQLADGDHVTIGSYSLVFCVPEPAPAPAPEPPVAVSEPEPPPSSGTQPFGISLLDLPAPAPSLAPPPQPPPPAQAQAWGVEFAAGPPAAGTGRSRGIALGIALATVLVVGIGITALLMLRGPSGGSQDVTVIEVSTHTRAADAEVDRLLQDANAKFAGRDYWQAAQGYAQAQQLQPGNATATRMGLHACEFMVVQAMADTLVERHQASTDQASSRAEALTLASEALAGTARLSQAQRAVAAQLEGAPDDAELLAAKGELSRLARRRSKARDTRNRAAHADEVQGLYDAAVAMLDRGDDMGAYAAFDRVAGADPDKLTEWVWKAEDQQQRIRAKRSEQAKTSYRAGLTAKRSGDYLTARRELRETLRIDPFHGSAPRHLEEVQGRLDQQALSTWARAEVYEQTNQTNLAIGEYQKVLSYSASSSSALAKKAQARIDALLQ